MIDAQRQSVLLAEISAVLVDDGQPVGVRVLAKADVGTRTRHFG